MSILSTRQNEALYIPTVLLGMVFVARTLVSSQSRVNIDEYKHKVMPEEYHLEKGNRSSKGMTITKCLQHCLDNCQCSSFQICKNEHCQLGSSTQCKSSSTTLRSDPDCSYYDIRFEKILTKVNNQQCSGSCTRSVNCCLTSSPCFNGGTCVPSDATKTGTRFTCKCPRGHAGTKCDEPIRSCGGYKSRRSDTGGVVLDVFGTGDELFPVYCYFDYERNVAWTLVQSHAYRKKDDFGPLHFDQHRDQKRPKNFEAYRLPKSKMLSIKADSSKWAITCFSDDRAPPGNESNRLVGNTSEVDILLPIDGCSPINDIHIRGLKCSSCTVHLKQDNSSILHMYYRKEPYTRCEFDEMMHDTNSKLPRGNYFGHYLDESTACNATTEKITQHWFGS